MPALLQLSHILSLDDVVTVFDCITNVKEDSNILRTVKRRKANWIGHILCRNCLLKHVFEGKVEGRRGRRRKQLLVYVKEKRGYWELKEEALDCTVWRTRFRRGYGPVFRADCRMKTRNKVILLLP